MALERRAQRQFLQTLNHYRKVQLWIYRFAPMARSLHAAVSPLVKLMSHTFNMPYAEIWETKQGETGLPKLGINSWFVMSFQKLFNTEAYFEHLGHSSRKNTCVNLWSREPAARALAMRKSYWNVDCVANCQDLHRRQLMMKLGLRRAFAVPIPIHRRVYHSLVLYGPSLDYLGSPSLEKLVTYATRFIGLFYGLTESCEHDNDDETKDEQREQEEEGPKGKRMELCL